MVRVRGPPGVSSVAMMKVEPPLASVPTALPGGLDPSTRSKQPSPSVQPGSEIPA
jgi:hypothetical protein